VQGAVRAGRSKNESKQDVKAGVNPHAGYFPAIVPGTIRHAGLIRVGTQECPSQGFQPYQILARMQKELTLLRTSMHRHPLSLHRINRVIGPYRIVADKTDFSSRGAHTRSDALSVNHCFV